MISVDGARPADGGDNVGSAAGNAPLGAIPDHVGHRSYGLFLLVPGLIAFLPTGTIPTMPTIMGATITIVAVQMLLARDHIRLPPRLQRLGSGSNRVRGAMERARPWAARLDSVIRPRLRLLTGRLATRLIGIVAIAPALLMPPLELLPVATATPSSASVSGSPSG